MVAWGGPIRFERLKRDERGERVARSHASGRGGVDVAAIEPSATPKAGGRPSRGALARRLRASGCVVRLARCARESRGVIATMASA
ncbi:lipid A biosynthesis acyltransferase [Burkholderia pseudomallei]|uniref:lipid A biosynthesis acyltransferase n=1 Tax=Burkholderia pseudomallei TaxID=28450 RepID=UPI0009778BFD|nr:lipid A biosynthesis acyltransferase [Burkholderia pseudomallei]